MAKDRFDPTPLPPARPPSMEVGSMRVKPRRPRGRGLVVKLVLFLLLGMSVGAVFVAKLLEGHADLEEQLERSREETATLRRKLFKVEAQLQAARKAAAPAPAPAAAPAAAPAPIAAPAPAAAPSPNAAPAAPKPLDAGAPAR
jgi:type II secretory pathway component PulM